MTVVVTLALDDASQAVYEALRRRWFPPARNLIPAHLTLFHQLPEDEATLQILRDHAEQHSRFWLVPAEMRSLGRGVACFLHSPESVDLHRDLRSALSAHVTPQDAQGFRPHIVVQNKADQDDVQQCLASLKEVPLPAPSEAVGLDVWRYLGGPWQHLCRIAFR